MSDPFPPELQARVDDFSCQVSTPADPRFWFRLVRDDDRDIITDYFLGAFPKEKAGSLLVECYRVLELTPRMEVVFRDIVPSSRTAADPQALAEMRDLYADCGKTLLTEFGARRVMESLQEEGGKYHLVLVGEC
jgi:hypothetical protein